MPNHHPFLPPPLTIPPTPLLSLPIPSTLTQVHPPIRHISNFCDTYTEQWLYSAHHIALTSGHFNKKRESTTSDITTMTLVGVGGNGVGGAPPRHSNGATNPGHQPRMACLLDAPIENVV
ncbi:hypothetical protein M8J76_004923 [Diaphorina citri]|nr:hypothetical protein M8J75_003289 [Diaphorina citri]KAI5749142.1 hypothetical protein M8J76_004923 [Diaphorina citri]